MATINKIIIYRMEHNQHKKMNNQEQDDNFTDQTTSEETGLVQRVRFGVINGSKNCTKTQSRACKIHLDFSQRYWPKGFCSLPVELGCSGIYKLLGMFE